MPNDKYAAPRQYPGVMVSSTFTDLEKHRAALIEAINGQGLHEVAMENDSAKPVDVIDSSIQMVRDGSAYIGVISHKYGQTPHCPRRNPDQLSITELEFNEAQRLERPIILFIMGDHHPGEKADFETDAIKLEKLNAFRERAKKMRPDSPVDRVYDTFNSLQQFATNVIHAVAGLRRYLDEKHTPASAVHESRTDDSNGFIYTFRPGQLPHGLADHLYEDLVVRKRELETLTERLSPNSIIPLEGVLQSGKTALVAKFLTSDSVRRKLTLGNQPLAEVSVLYIDLEVAIGPRPVLRRLAYALGELKRIPDADGPEEAAFEEIRAQLLYEILLERLKSRVPLVVLDDIDLIPERDHNVADLRALLEFRQCRHGAILVLTSRPISKKLTTETGREIKKSIQVGSLAPSEAEQLLGRLLNDQRLAGETIALIKTDPDLLLPGAFVEGIAAYKSQLNVGSVGKNPAALADTILECASADVLKTLKIVGCEFTALSDGTFGKQISIAAMAVLAKQPVTEQHLLSSELPVEYFERLRNQGWFQKRSNGLCLPAIVYSALRLQIETLLKGSGGEKARNQLADALDALIQAVEREGTQKDDALLDVALEEAIAWLERRLPGEKLLGNRLWRAFLPHTTDDLIAPISAGDSIELLNRLGDPSEPASMATAIAKLVLDIRAGNDAHRFMEGLRAAIGLAKKESAITVHQLRGLDGAAFSGTGRYQLLHEVFELREQLIEKLCAWANSASATPDFKRTAASWLLTTADLGFRLGKSTTWSKRLLDQSTEWLEAPQNQNLTGSAESELGWLRARASRLATLLETNPEARIKHLHSAVAGAEHALLYGARRINQTQFYLRTVRNLLSELSQEDQRRQAVNAAMYLLGRTFGDKRDEWPLEIQAQFATLLRYEASLVNSPQLRLSQLREAVQFFKSAESRAVYLANQGDTRPLLVLARLHRALVQEQVNQGQYRIAEESLNEARRLAELAVKRNANAATWGFLVAIGNYSFEATTSFGWNFELIERVLPHGGNAKKDLTKRCRHWLDGIVNPGIPEGRVALQCFQCEWQVRGSLIRVCIEEATSQGSEWERLRPDDKRNSLRHHYLQRIGKLQHTEKRYGNFLELALARIRLEAQFVYFLALLRNDGVVETAKVISLFQQAAKRFPDSRVLDIERARFYRRIWSYGEAIAGFTLVAERTRDAAERRDAAIDLIESLTTASIHTASVQLPDGTRLEKQALINQARDWLDRLFNFPDVAKEVAILRDQVELELGLDINWTKNDDAYKAVIGGSESYCLTVVDHLDSLRSESSAATAHLWEAVIQNFTHPEVLRGLGRLYLRSAERDGRGQPLQDAEQAYGCFNACRLLEVSELGRESSVTSYERARAILAGATIARSVNPFKADHESSKSLLDLAEARFSSAIDRSVGGFHQAAIERIKELRMLRSSLKRDAK